MTNIVEVTYAQTGESTKVNDMGMREMQARAYEARNEQYLLLKAPPASGKSRALMFLALDKLRSQGVRKAIIAVPERSIGSSFASTPLSNYGFFTDWVVQPEHNLCTPGGDQGKVKAFVNFLEGAGEVLVCTHATLRFAFEAIEEELLNDCVLAIDEFHHVSADVDSKLGFMLRSVMQKSTAHVIAMTGSYFRGDSVPVLLPEDEAKFVKVTYNYYEQLNGYTYLKSLGIGYHFYQRKYLSAIAQVLDTDKKTILHIPSVRSGESTQDKYNEVDTILDTIGTVRGQDPDTGVITVERKSDGRILKVADLVHDEPKARDKIVGYLRTIKSPDDLDLIIALGMAKEGFDWSFCEHALTVGYRGSLTEIIQIIGRCTRDSPNKSHAQFTNLIAQPDAHDDLVKLAVNNMLKAITCSLLMEQVLAPNFKFKTKHSEDDKAGPGEIKISGFKEPSSKRLKDIIEGDLNDLKAVILQDDAMLKAMPGNVDPEVINKVLIPKIIRIRYPDLSDEDVETVRQHIVADSVLKSGEFKEDGDQRFIKMAGKFVNIDDLHIDLIDQINPFQAAFEILSKSVTASVLKTIQEAIEATRIVMTSEEAVLLWPKIKEFTKIHGRPPSHQATDALEARMGEALIYIRVQRQKQGV
ncbi:Superfamily II DNA or RNA helicase [Variovorax sp. YR266]|uniref:DEAD/DEAH box helicase n=1 Tax=Variovorax sp. YR266 TaxID=1884386 RepID=UPI000898C562|nr:DEAD/DEAH box helicase family protein [Variovorax sp. YR266]SDZ72280.1 Superfamily II DNA or RNA helicase [Variovorax sp. YR266]